eukprot:CAMPEP_0185041628 /NCGR_PEP_ID=MMETSP1103-20130426/41202_1 /TAXON_ID=36769 /ORGANISM="Paraphysomonas bandaiensis, Strain Caron Lab Isolate" /LENGTH=411 /DNA_ID=CAMNT_0027581459 /DNA_START=141 /DNA_END=1376 /DNA_ORIENTATION=-
MYLQGGPGFPSPRPTAPPSGWMKSALNKGYRLLLLDQRGTGRSTAMTIQRLKQLADEGGVEKQAHYLRHMRSDAIAHDIEAIRKELCGPMNKISLLGQSFGGFCMLSYLSQYPFGAETCLFTCGLAPVTKSIREVYIATYRRMLVRSRRFYARYPEDISRIRAVVAHLYSREQAGDPVVLLDGGRLTVRRFQQLGLLLGSGAGMEAMHWLMEDPFHSAPGTSGLEELSESFLASVMQHQSGFESSPIYWLMHESIYMNGAGTASEWTAETVIKEAEFADAFDAVKALQNDDQPINFTGEMVFSWMSEDYARLAPLKDVANILANERWERPLYDLSSLINVARDVSCAALVSYDDVFVEREFSEATADLLGGSDLCRMWVTNEFQHSGVRDDPCRVFDTLYKMAKNELSIPS